MKFYAKELPDSAVYVLGHPMTFDFLETSDATLISELDKCAARGVGGVREIAAETYAEELKKKELGTLSGHNSKPLNRRTELSAALLGNPGAAVAGSFARRQDSPTGQDSLPRPLQGGEDALRRSLPDPISVPAESSFDLPPTAKMNKTVSGKVGKPVSGGVNE